AGTFVVSPVSSGSSSPNTGIVHLGQTNTINATTFNVSVGKATSTLDFRSGLVAPTLKIRGTGGTDADRATIIVGTNDSGAAANVATMDVSAGVLDAMVGTLTIAANTRNNTAGFASTGTLVMGQGTLNATNILLGQQAAVSAGNFSGNSVATLTLNGGTITVGSFTLANKLSGTATATINSTFNLNSGTLNATTIQRGTVGTGAGANTATINFNWVDGTISNISGSNQTVSGNTAVNGLTGGLNIALNNTGNVSGTHTWNVGGTQTSTVQNTVTLSGTGGLTKTGTGTLSFAGANTYGGPTLISAGTVKFGTEASLYNGNTASWTPSNLVVSSGAAAVFNVGGAGEFTSADIDILKGLGTGTGGFLNGAILGLDTTNAGGNFTYASRITNNNTGANVLGFVKQGGGTLTLTAANAYTGGTSINGGTLALSGGNNRLANTGVLNFTGTSGTQTLDLGSTSQTVGGLTFPKSGSNTNVITGAAGTLNVTAGNVQVGGGDATTASSAITVNMSGLGNFVYNVPTGAFNVGGTSDSATSATTANGTLSLAANSTITAASFNVGFYSTGNSAINSGTVHLGQTNTINATTFLVGNQKTVALLDFQSGLTAPTLKIRGTGGTDTDRANITIGTNNSGVSPTTATFDLTGGTVDAMVGTMIIGQNARQATALGLPTTGTFTMGLGTLNATSITIGQQQTLTGGNTFSGPATGTLNLNGGNIITTTLTLADKGAAATAQTITSNLNLNSGTLAATTIQRGTAGTGAGASTATINFNWVDGTISNIAGASQTVSGVNAVSGLTGGLNIVLNNTGNSSGTHTWNVTSGQTATVQSTAILSGSGALTKTGAGTLVFTGANTYIGLTTVSAGELDLNTTGSTALAGDLLVNGGTAKLLQASQLSTTSSVTASTGGTLALQGFNQTVANVHLTGGSITGSGGVLTSTNAFDLQAGSVSATLGGTAGLTKSGAGTVTLSGANTYTGSTSITGGTLIATNAGALGTNNNLNIGAGGTFAYQPGTGGALALGTGLLTLTGGSAIGTTVTSTPSTITSSAVASASGAVRINIYGTSSTAAGATTLVTTGGGLTAGGATYTPTYYNLTNLTASNFQATDTAISVTLTSATALTNAYWKGGLGVGNNVWAVSTGTASNWASDAAGTATALVPGSTTAVIFSTTTGATNQGAMTLGANMSIKSLTVNDSNAVTLNADGNALTIANSAGITVNSGAGAVTLNAPITLGASQTWTNGSANTLTVGGAITEGSNVLTVSGTGTTTISGAIAGTGGVTKSGTGTLNLTGQNTFTNTTTTGLLNITAGTVNVSGSLVSAITVGGAGTSAMLNIQNGASLSGTNMQVTVGSGVNSAGGVYQTGGDILLNNNFNLGLGGSVAGNSYGFYSMSGGTLADTGGTNVRFRIGGGASYATGVFYQSGGTANVTYTNGLEVAANASSNFIGGVGIAYLTGGAFTAVSNRIGFNSVTTSTGDMRGEETIAGNAQVTINGSTWLGLAANDVGILNLNGGVYATRTINKNGGSGTAIVNFNGGTLKAAASATGATFLTGITSANIYAGGATIDTNGQSVTIGQALVAPSGSGVATIPVTNGGSGYVGAPLVTISGAGSGATAVANMVDDGTGKGTFKIASITITSPGQNYTSAPTITVSGGGGSGAVFGTVTTAANISGGLTKTGNGTLTLTSATSTYTGNTEVNQGTLLVSGSISGSTVDVNNGGTLGGANGTVGAINVNAGGILSPGNGIGKLNSTGPLTLLGGGTFKLEINSTTVTNDILATTGSFNLSTDNDAVLTISDLAVRSTTDSYFFITYATGGWNGGLFTYNGSVIHDGDTLNVGSTTYRMDYDWNGNTVALLAVPEPGTLVPLLGGASMLVGLRRLRRRVR
ncbi:MAG: beta strand repeat-containing protein, partial [Chthoniobacter sp.]